MIYNRCSRCNTRYPAGTKCKCYAKHLANNKPNVNIYYNTAEWKAVRKIAIAKTFGLDIYSLLVLNKIEYGYTVHHITPLESDYEQRNKQNNLIYLTESNHRIIHEKYKTNCKNTKILLFSILEKFSNIFNGG